MEREDPWEQRPVAPSEERPVPLDFEFREKPLQDTIESLMEQGRAPVYVVHFTQASAVEPQLATAFREGTRQSDADLETLYDDLVLMGKIPDADDGR